MRGHDGEWIGWVESMSEARQRGVKRGEMVMTVVYRVRVKIRIQIRRLYIG